MAHAGEEIGNKTTEERGMRAECLSESGLVHFTRVIRELQASLNAKFTQPFTHSPYDFTASGSLPDLAAC